MSAVAGTRVGIQGELVVIAVAGAHTPSGTTDAFVPLTKQGALELAASLFAAARLLFIEAGLNYDASAFIEASDEILDYMRNEPEMTGGEAMVELARLVNEASGGRAPPEVLEQLLELLRRPKPH